MKKREQIEARYRANLAQQPEFSDYIYSQWDDRVKELSYGKRGHIGREGCGAVAVYNAMKFIGKQQDFCGVLRDMEELNMTWLGAKFGTRPYSLSKYFRRHKIPFRKYTAPVDFKAALLSHKIGIVCTWNRRFYGMHFYCVYYSPEEKAYHTMNLDTPCSPGTAQLGDISNLRFIIGYVVD